MADLEGRVIVITGASSGLGAGMASWFSDQGASLGVCARRTPDLVGNDVVTRSVDVRDLEVLQSFAADVSRTLGPIDLWINNAAALRPISSQRELAISDLMAHLEVNVGGVLNGTRAFLGQLVADDHRGALVNISSGLAQKGRGGLSAYAAAKAGVDRLTEIAAIEEGDRLTMALAVSPGMVETPMQAVLREQDPEVLLDLDMFRQRKASGSMNSPAWVAGTIANWVFGPEPPVEVVLRVPQEPGR